MGRDQAAMEQYQVLAEETPPGSIRDLFRFLAAQELEHRIREALLCNDIY
jgi:rubrerythrin